MTTLGCIADDSTGATDLAGDLVATGHRTVVCLGVPATGRTVYQGHPFVGGRRLSENGMRHHPLAPTTDRDPVRVLARPPEHPDRPSTASPEGNPP
jgi:uncharacterized protein YgbK (DUF1537 family)